MSEYKRLVHPNGFVLGTACPYEGGWRFVPNVSGRKPGKKASPSPEACLPGWAKKHLKAGATLVPAAAAKEVGR